MAVMLAKPVLDYGNVIAVEGAKSEVGLRLLDGRAERIHLSATRATTFTVREPVLGANGSYRMDLEVLSFKLEGKSEVLWPGATIRIIAGARSDGSAKPVYGTVDIPVGRSLEDGVPTEVRLYAKIETPIGILQNARAIRMTGSLHAIPPLTDLFRSQEDVPVLDEGGNVVGTLWACGTQF